MQENITLLYIYLYLLFWGIYGAYIWGMCWYSVLPIILENFDFKHASSTYMYCSSRRSVLCTGIFETQILAWLAKIIVKMAWKLPLKDFPGDSLCWRFMLWFLACMDIYHKYTFRTATWWNTTCWSYKFPKPFIMFIAHSLQVGVAIILEANLWPYKWDNNWKFGPQICASLELQNWRVRKFKAFKVCSWMCGIRHICIIVY